MNDERSLLEIMTDIIAKLNKQPIVQLPNVSESDKVYYDLEAMRKLQKQNPHCRIITNAGAEIHISYWIAILENMKRRNADER